MKQTKKGNPFKHLLGGLLLAGIGFSSSGLHAQTSVKWQQATGSTNQAEYWRDVVVDGQGNVYAVGSFQGTANFTFPGPLNFPLISAGGYDIVIAKYNRAGTLLWVERGGGTGNDYGLSIAIHTDLNGTVDNVFTTGTYVGGVGGSFTGSADAITGIMAPTAGGEDIFTTVHSTTGVLKLFRRDGGPGNDRAQGLAVQQTTATSYNLIAGGYIDNNAVFTPHPAIPTALRDGYVCRYVYDNTFVTLTVPTQPVTFSTPGNDQVTNAGIHFNGEVYATGAYEGLLSLGGGSVPTSLANTALADAFVVRMNANASLVLNGNRLSSAGQDYAYSLTFDRNGNTYVCGYYSGPATTLDAGMTLPNVLFASRDFWVGKLTVVGGGLSFIALEKGGTMNDDRAYDIIADNCGDRIFVAGMVGTGYGNMTYTTSGAAVILPSLAVTKLNGMLLQLDRNLANPVAYQTYGATTVAGVVSSLQEALYGVGINNVGDINIVGVTSGTNNSAGGGSNVIFSDGTGATLLSTPMIWTNNATADLNYNFYMASIDMSQWPASAVLPLPSCGVGGNGIAMRDCFVYEGGDFRNPAGAALTIGTTVFGTANQDAYLVKYDLYGNPLAGTRVTVSDPVLGNVRVGDICTALSPTADVYECGTADSDPTGTLTIAGFTSTLIANPTGSHLFLASYNDMPATPFVPNWRVFDEAGNSTAIDVYADLNGDIFLTGTYSTAMSLVHNGVTLPIPAPAFATMYIMKINPAGTILWFNGAIAAAPVSPGGISCILGNTPIVVGSTFNGVDNDVFIHSFVNGTGAPLINYSPASTPGNQSASEISVIENGNLFAITGTFNGTFALGATPAITATGSPNNMFAGVYSIPLATWMWSRDEGDMGLGTLGADIGFRDQSVIVTGSYQNGAQFNGVAQTSAGSWDIYWSRYNAITGTPINTVNTAGGTSGDFGMAVLNLNGALPEADQFGNCALSCGFFNSPTVAFGSNTLTNTGTGNLFITKLNSQSAVFSQRLGAPAEEETEASTITDPGAGLNVIAMPNPFSASTVINITGFVPDNAVIKLYDVSGRLVDAPMPVTSNSVTIDGAMLENGIYIFRIESGDAPLFTGKLMVQH